MLLQPGGPDTSLPDRDVDDIGDQTLTFAEVKALATGDPLILEKASVDADIARLARLERAHHDDQARLRRTIERQAGRLTALNERATRLRTAAASMVDTRGDRFRMQHAAGLISTARADAGERIRKDLDVSAAVAGVSARLGTLGGLSLEGRVDEATGEVVLHLPEADASIRYARDGWSTADGAALTRRVERLLQQVPADLQAVEAEMSSAQSELARAKDRLGSSFPGTADLDAARRRAREIDDLLMPNGPAAPVTEAGASPAARAATQGIGVA